MLRCEMEVEQSIKKALVAVNLRAVEDRTCRNLHQALEDNPDHNPSGFSGRMNEMLPSERWWQSRRYLLACEHNCAMRVRARQTYFLTLLLLLIAAAHTLRLSGLEMNPDEIWAIWQTLGKPDEIIAWTPYDWTPLYYLTLGGWRLGVGIHPIALRYFSVLLSLLGAAFTYRVGKRLGGSGAGSIAMLIYSALPYSIFLSGYVRPYALAHVLVPLSFWLTLRYFDGAFSWRRRWLDCLLLTLALTATFYTTLVAPVFIAFIGLFTVIVYGISRAARLWIPVALPFVLLSLPIILSRVALVVERVSVIAPLRPFGEAIVAMLAEYTGDLWWVWAALLVFGLLASARAFARDARRNGAGAAAANGASGKVLLALATWGFGGLVVMYFTNPVLGFFNPAYAFWTLTGMALFGGLALAKLPQQPRSLVIAVAALMLFVEPPERVTRNYAAPGVSIFSRLQEPGYVQAGDVVVLDPDFDCLAPYELDYLLRAFFPEGLPVVTSPDGYRRVWYAADIGRLDAETAATVAHNRRAGISAGPPDCLWQLYEAPPDAEGVLFENGMRFHGAEALDRWTGAPLTAPLVVREGEAFRVRLWWSVDEAPELDYSVGVYVFNHRGRVVAQSDSAPQVTDPAAPPETSRWQPGRYYVEERTIQLPYPLTTRTYRLALTVYQWWDNVRIAAPGTNADRLLPLLDVNVKSWHESPDD